jgi:TolB-like protein/Tfp pilus assembly protein PilF
VINLKRIFAELKRRNVYRAAVLYGMSAWLLAQITTQIFPFFNVPNSAVRFVIIALILGFPIAMALSWLYELTPGGFVRTEDVDLPRQRQFGRKIDFVIIGALLLVIALLVYQRLPFRTENVEAIPDKSIAVLPFANFSEEKANAFFAAGVQDDILTSLAEIKELRVISRSSVMQFRDPAAAGRNLRDIAKSLGVANILEGSVRREGDRVVVNVQLIDARTDRHIWANRYDRTLTDALGLQGELASEIADALRANLSADEKTRVAIKPTQNPDAYVFYLRANQISRNPDTLLEDYKTAEQLYTQAIALDANFALAHARLASVRAEIFHYYEPTDAWKLKARQEAETALRLQPDLAEGHFALGQCIYWMDQDYDRALEQFEIASRLSPSNGDIGRLIAAIKRRQGKWQEALEAYERVAKIDPQNPNIVRELIFINTAMRRWPEAAGWVKKMRAMAPASLVAKVQTGYVDFWWKGDTRLLKSLLSEVPADVDPDGTVTSCRWDVAMLDRDYATAGRVLEISSLNEVSYTNAGSTPKTFLQGCIYLAQGDNKNAQKAFETARPSFEASVEEAPLSADRHANLGWLYAFMGRKNEAIREGRRAVELKPESKDAVDSAIMNCYLALIYARVGEKDLAIPLIERLLKTPGAVDSVDYSITVNDLKYRWEWDPIRSDPRFQKLLEQPAK